MKDLHVLGGLTRKIEESRNWFGCTFVISFYGKETENNVRCPKQNPMRIEGLSSSPSYTDRYD